MFGSRDRELLKTAMAELVENEATVTDIQRTLVGDSKALQDMKAAVNAVQATLAGVKATLDHHTRKLEKIMSDQSHLDADVQRLVAATNNVKVAIDQLKAANPSVDFSTLDAAISDVEALAPAPPPDQPPA